jgi:putative flippase GtrA
MFKWLENIFWIIWKWWFRWPDKLRFLCVGSFNALVSYLLYVFLVWCWGENKFQAALVVSWLLSTFSSFATQKIFVFCTKGKFKDWVKEYVKCLGVWVISYIINAIVLEMLVKFCDLNVYVAQIIATACTTISSYVLMKYFAFKY